MAERETEDSSQRTIQKDNFEEIGPVTLNADDRYVVVAANIENHTSAQSIGREVWLSADGVNWVFGGAGHINEAKARDALETWLPFQARIPDALFGRVTQAKGRCVVSGRNLRTKLRLATSDVPIDMEKMSRNTEDRG